MPLLKLTEAESDQLKEIFHIATGQASIALSQLTNQKIPLGVPSIYLEPIEKIPSQFENSERLVAALVVNFLGDLNGTVLIILSETDAVKLAGLLTNSPKATSHDFDKLDISALEETANILAGHAITGLWNFLSMPVRYAPPSSAIDMESTILEEVATKIGSKSSEVLLFKSDFAIDGEPIRNRLLFVFSPESSRKILEIVKAKFDGGERNR